MPPVSAILLTAVALTGANPPLPPEPGGDTPAYETAFDEPSRHEPQIAGAAQPTAEGRQAIGRPARVLSRLSSDSEMQRDSGVEAAVVNDPEAPLHLKQAATNQALPLAPPTKESSLSLSGLPNASMPTVLVSLGAVIGLFLILSWFMRRGAPRGSRALPPDVFDVLGRATLAGRQQVHLLRLGSRLVLVSISQSGTETLCEISDPLEVERLSALCYHAHPHGSKIAFRQVFQSFEPPRAGATRARSADRLDFSHLDALPRGVGGPEVGDGF